jgi:nucleotide-binding universal stress UspA family protein
VSAPKQTDGDRAPPRLPGHEVETIITAARDGKFDLLVVGFVGHSNVFGRVMGSTTQNISRLSPCSVLIVK